MFVKLILFHSRNPIKPLWALMIIVRSEIKVMISKKYNFNLKFDTKMPLMTSNDLIFLLYTPYTTC